MAARAPIRLNGVTLPPQMIAAEAQNHPARTPAAAFQSAARALIVRTLLLEEARRQRLEASPELIAEGKRETEDEALIRVLLDRMVPVPLPSQAECRAFYASNPGRFRSPDLFEASHILFAADPGDTDAYAEAGRKAARVLAQVRQSPRLFETIAGQQSDCGSKSSGGRLGQFPRGETVAEFETVLDTLEPGTVAPDPVRTRFGVHVLRLDARAGGEVLPFDYVRERIEAYLAERQWRLAVARFIDDLMGTATIEGIDMTRDEKKEVLAQ